MPPFSPQSDARTLSSRGVPRSSLAPVGPVHTRAPPPVTNNAEDEDEDMTVQDEGRPQEEEERMVEETRERLGKTLRDWLPKNDVLASLIPVDMLADQIVGDVDITQEDAARKRKGGKVSGTTTTSSDGFQHDMTASKKTCKEISTSTTNLFASFLGSSSTSRQQQQRSENNLSKERLIEIEEEREVLYSMTIWIEHHVEPVLKHLFLKQPTTTNFIEEEEEEQSESTCGSKGIIESRSSSCSYILPFPNAPGLLDLMQKMTISTVPPYATNPFSVKPKPGINSDLTASPM